MKNVDNSRIKALPFYYINLDKHTDRREYIENHFAIHGITNVTRIKAVTTDEVERHPDLSLTETACTASHLKAVRTFLESGNDFAIICEDDAYFANIDVNKIELDDFLSKTDEDVCVQLAIGQTELHPINFELHEKATNEFGTTVYLINRAYAQKIDETFGNDPTLSKFVPEMVMYPEGHIDKTRPVADVLIYSLMKVKSYPCFSYEIFDSTIDGSGRHRLNLLWGRRLYDYYWFGTPL